VTRIFAVLATLTACALLVAFGLGMTQLVEPIPQRQAWRSFSLPVSWHIVAALVASVLVLLVHCLVFTYLLGTGRWVKEVSQAYGVPQEEGIAASRQLKRQAYPSAMLAMLVVIFTAGSGAAIHTDPDSWIGLTHPVLSVLTLLANGWAFVREYQVIRANQAVLDRMMSFVQSRQAMASGQPA
jgi:H+/gluconate symporter-like permease